MKLINIKEDKVYKHKTRNIYYKRFKNIIFRSLFLSDLGEAVNDIEELQSDVFDMSNPKFDVKYDVKYKEIKLKIRQANMIVCLDSLMVIEMLETIQEVMEAPF